MYTFPATPNAGFNQMYLYTDCIHPQPHLDGNVNICALLPSMKNRMQYVSKRFEKVLYYPLKAQTLTTSSFDLLTTSSFNLLDDTRKHVGSDTGKVLIVLHFRRKNL